MGDAQVTSISFGPKNKRGVCSECALEGKVVAAYKGSATKCDKHKKGSTVTRTARPVSDATTTVSPEEMAAVAGESRAPRVDVPAGDKTVVSDNGKSAKIAEYKRRILNEGNPELVKGFAQLCKPIPPENFYNITEHGVEPTERGQVVTITSFEADILARAAVELESSPVVAMGQGAVAPVMPYLLGFAAIGIIGFHAVTAMSLRQQMVEAFKAQLAMEAAAQQHTPQGHVPDSGGIEDVQPEATVLRPVFTEQSLVENATE